MPMPFEEALVAVVVDRDDLVVEQVEHGDGGLLAVELGGGPLADELAGQVVVGGEGDVDGVGRVGRGVERDDEQAGVAGLLDGGDDGVAVGVMRMPLSPVAMASSMAVIWVAVSPSSLPAATVSLTPLLRRPRPRRRFCIETKNGLVVFFRMSETPILGAARAAGTTSNRRVLSFLRSVRVLLSVRGQDRRHIGRGGQRVPVVSGHQS